jgi:putative transposase
VNYKHEALVNQVEKSLKKIVRDICAAQEVELEEMETDKNPIHLLLSMRPQHSIPSVVKTLKGQLAKIVGGKTNASRNNPSWLCV